MSVSRKLRIYERNSTQFDCRGFRLKSLFKLENRCSIQLSYHCV